jgi:hypothetical protein
MSGRIKLYEPTGTLVNPSDSPALYNNTAGAVVPGVFDQQCGTFGLEEWKLPNSNCPDRFVCGSDQSVFASCIEAANCKMLAGESFLVSAEKRRKTTLKVLPSVMIFWHPSHPLVMALL